MIKRILTLVLLAAGFCAAAQTTADQFASRYATLVKNVGVAGVGVETLLDKWEAAYPQDVEMNFAKFLFHFSKSQSTEVVQKSKNRYLGQEPLMSLKDSLGIPVYFFQENVYDDAVFGLALQYLDKAIQRAPNRLDMRLYRVSALVGYEKESPDMATSELRGLIDYNFTRKPAWEYPGLESVSADFFDVSIQEYCFTFFRYASPSCYEAFKSLSEKMLSFEKDNPLFVNNIGSYYLVYAHDNRKALKCYNQVLKKHPDDLTAINNCIILARNSKDVKMEKKYLPMLIKYSPDEKTVESAKIRLEALSAKK